MDGIAVRFLSGEEQNVDNVPIQQGKVLFAVNPDPEGIYYGYIYYDFYDAGAQQTVRVCMSGGGEGGIKVASTLNIADNYGHEGNSVVIANVPKATLKLPDIIEARYYIAQDTFTDQYDLFNIGSRVYGNGFLMANEYAPAKMGWTRLIGSQGLLDTVLEIAMGDSLTDANNTNTIVARLYDKNNSITQEAILLNGEGNASFPNNVTAQLFIGNLQGNADTATNATNDSSGHEIQTTYLADIKENRSTSTEFSIQSLTGAGQVKNIVKIPNASRSVAGLITASAQVLSGAKTLNSKGSLTIEGAHAFIYTGIQEEVFDKDSYIWFSYNDEDGTPVYNDKFTFNSETKTLKVTNITGDYEYLSGKFGTNITGIITNAMSDGNGKQIDLTYIAKLKPSTSLAYNNNKGTNFSIGGFNGIGEEVTTLRIPNATNEIAGLVTTNSQTFSGDKTFLDNIIIANSGYTLNANPPFGSNIIGLRGHMADTDDWVIRGYGSGIGDGYLEFATGIHGDEPIFFSQYHGNPSSNSASLVNTATILDKNGGTAINFLTIDKDSNIANTDYALRVHGESSFLDVIYAEQSIRLSAVEKGAYYYIVPNDNLPNQFTTNHPEDYYAFLQSLLIQETLEVNGLIYFNNTLTTYDIIPAEHDIYTIGKGTPNDSEELYYNKSYIKSMYSNWNIIQGEVFDDIPPTYLSANPKITFQENISGAINNPIHLIYMNHYIDDSYDTINGLRLTGEIRPWLDIDGSIYSRYDFNKYIQSYANDNEVGQFITFTGLSSEGDYILTKVSESGATQYLQHDVNYNNIKISSEEGKNIIQSSYNFGVYSSYLTSTVTGGTSELLIAGTDEVFIKTISDLSQENSILIQTSTDIFNKFTSNLKNGFNIIAQFPNSSINAYNDADHCYYIESQYNNNMKTIESLEDSRYNFSAVLNDNIYLDYLVNAENVGIKLKSAAGTWSYIELNDSTHYWDIGINSETDSETSSLQSGSLQFRKNNSSLRKIAFVNSDDIGINLYGDSPFIDFRYRSSDQEFKSSIQAITPILDAYGLLEVKGQVIFSDVIQADTSIANGGTLIIGPHRGAHLEIDNNQILAKSSATTGAQLSLNTGGGRVFIGPGGLDIGKSNTSYMFNVSGSTFLDGTAKISETLTVKGKTYLEDEVNVGANILPTLHETYDLGSEKLAWNNIYAKTFHGLLDGTANNAIKDSEGNQITLKYVTLDTTQNILATKVWQTEQIFSASNGFRLNYGTYGVVFKNDGSYFHIKLTNAGSGGTVGNNYNALEPFKIDLATGDAYSTRLYGAVWNDYAEFRRAKDNSIIQAGRCVCELGDGTLTLSTERLQPGGNIVSDTYGFAIGQTNDAQMPLAVSGRALAYTYESRDKFKAGDAVCTGPNGTVSLMTREEIIYWPDRIVGIVSEIPDYETWGTGNIKVDGRIWIKVR